VQARKRANFEEATMADQTKITALDNGPYLVKGSVVLLDAEGNEFRAERATVALCRCGRSANKPFCDGTHSKIGFRAAERAVRQDEGGAELAGRRMV
jgi:CDGSH-type Zn-finger protein